MKPAEFFLNTQEDAHRHMVRVIWQHWAKKRMEWHSDIRFERDPRTYASLVYWVKWGDVGE